MAAKPQLLSMRVRELVVEQRNKLGMSAASAWEIAMLQRLDRIQLPDLPSRFIPEALQHLNIVPVPIGFTTAISAVGLPLIHRDPFDRLIIAEALKEKLTVITKDRQFERYGVSCLW
jgi:PIN domain nuclease of toxin-antitoxin system